MEKLTQQQINDLKNFWEYNGDLERYCDFEKLKPQIQEQLPELLKAWNDYKLSKKIMSIIVESI